MAESIASTRSWTPFTTRSSTPTSSKTQSSSASIRSMRKRSSFLFGRSRSDNSKPADVSSLITIEQEDTQEPTSRPPTSYSTHTTQSRRSNKAERLEAIRSSILGPRRTESALSLTSRARGISNASTASHRSGFRPSLVNSRSDDGFNNEDQFYRHRRKASISPPFNFEHVTHTAKTQLPALDTVEEQDLPREFWSTTARQRPKPHLNGIEAQDIPKEQLQDSDQFRPSTALFRPVSPLTPAELEFSHHANASLDNIIADLSEPDLGMIVASQPRSEQDSLEPQRADESHEPPCSPTDIRHPRRYSSLSALDRVEKALPSLPRLDTFYESDSSSLTIDAAAHNAPEVPQLQPNAHRRSFSDVMHPILPSPEEIEVKSRQPLPPLPDKSPSRKNSKRLQSILKAKSSPTLNTLAEPTLIQAPSRSSKGSSKGSSQYSRRTRESICHSTSTDLRYSSCVSDATWEDDVDFIYQQEAESTCDFKWEIPTGMGHLPDCSPSTTSSDEIHYHAHSPITVLSEVSSISRPNGYKETLAQRRKSRLTKDPSRGLPVGHRGFLAARSTSQDDFHQKHAPTHQFTPRSIQPSNISPVLSVDHAPNTDPKHPAATFRDSIVGYLNPDFLSDPESCRNSGSTTAHRKSSSYGSHESNTRRLPNPARETARWSLASASSLPELMHSRPKGKVLVSKTIISAPLESLPQSPAYELDAADHGVATPIQPLRNSFVMRRSQVGLMHAAGRKTQERGGRAGTPGLNRFSVVSEVGGVGLTVSSANPDGPGWI